MCAWVRGYECWGRVTDHVVESADFPVRHAHPFYTGRQKIMDTEGRVERFKKRYAKRTKKKAAAKAEAPAAETPADENTEA